MSDYPVYHGNHLAFTLTERVDSADVVRASIIRKRDGTFYEPGEWVRCDGCQQTFPWRIAIDKAMTRGQH